MLPTSLNSLVTFESASRHKSYSLAAAELHITHSAVSQQMRLLEENLGISLFERQGRQMILTTAGAQLLKQILPALRQITRAISNVQLEARAPAIRVATLQSFATFWLLPRLGQFQSRDTNLTIHIQASIDLIDLDRSEADLAIRFGLGQWKGCDAEKLFGDMLYPVCSPKFNGGQLPSSLVKLKSCRILCDESRTGWDTWSKYSGIDTSKFKHETHHSDSNLMLTAAKAGQGIAMGRHSLVAGDIAAGNLVRLFDIHAPSDFSYYLVTATGGKKLGIPALSFVEWLREEALAFAAKM